VVGALAKTTVPEAKTGDPAAKASGPATPPAAPTADAKAVTGVASTATPPKATTPTSATPTPTPTPTTTQTPSPSGSPNPVGTTVKKDAESSAGATMAKAGTTVPPVAANKTDASRDKIGAPDKASEPSKPVDPPKSPKGRFVGAAASAGAGEANPGSGPASQERPTVPDEERDTLTPAPTAVRHRRVSGRVVIVLVVLLLAIGAAGGWYYKRHHSSTTRPATAAPKKVAADVALAGRVGILAADLPGWTTIPGSAGNAFNPTLASSPAATAAASKSTATLASCLKVPALDVSRAFGGPSPTRVALFSTPTYSDAAIPGTTASSVVDVMRGSGAERTDFKAFANPTLFASCYQAYAVSLIPYAATAAGPVTSVTVQPATLPAPSSSRLHVQGFTITRTGPAGSATTTAVAVFGGRMQATLALVSPTAFPVATQTSLLTGVEGRIAGSLPTKS
jgi:hypothetical protein